MITIEEKVLVISDVHLTGQFDQLKYDFLVQILKDVHTVVIAGDFLDLYVADFASINRQWSRLFQVLKTKDTYYLFGNHDSKRPDIDYSIFSKSQSDRFEFRQAGQVFRIEHGHKLAPYADTTYKNFPRFLLPVGSYWDRVMTRLLGKLFLRVYKRDNERMKHWQKTHVPKETFLICGHSHWAEVSLEEKYANTGLVNSGIGQYLTLEHGTVNVYTNMYERSKGER